QARMQALGEAVDNVLGAAGLLEMSAALDQFDDGKKRLWRDAKQVELAGSSHLSHFAWRDAIEHYQKALDQFDSLGWACETAQCLSSLGQCYDSLGQYASSVEYYTRALGLCKVIGDPTDVARALDNLGMCYYSMDQADKAIEYYSKALALHRQTGNS